MFLPTSLHSVNSPSDLAPGQYGIECHYYGPDETGLRAMFVDYVPASGKVAAACDLLVVEPDGAVRARDFVLMADRAWRDSDGTKSDRLAALLPKEIAKLPFARSERHEPIQVGESR